MQISSSKCRMICEGAVEREVTFDKINVSCKHHVWVGEGEGNVCCWKESRHILIVRNPLVKDDCGIITSICTLLRMVGFCIGGLAFFFFKEADKIWNLGTVDSKGAEKNLRVRISGILRVVRIKNGTTHDRLHCHKYCKWYTHHFQGISIHKNIVFRVVLFTSSF